MRTSKAKYNLLVITEGEGSRQEKGKRKEKFWDKRDESNDDSEENKESGSYIDVSCLLDPPQLKE